MGCLPDPSQAPTDCKSLLQSVHSFFKAKNETTLSLDLPHSEQRATEGWRALSNATSNVYTTVLLHIEQKLKDIKEHEHHRTSKPLALSQVDFLTHMIHSGELSIHDAKLNSFDLIGGGVDTVSVNAELLLVGSYGEQLLEFKP